MSEIQFKIQILRPDGSAEYRRVRMMSPTFKIIEYAMSEYVKGSNLIIEYVDDENDFIAMESEEEWQQCIDIQNRLQNCVVRIRLTTQSYDEFQDKKCSNCEYACKGKTGSTCCRKCSRKPGRHSSHCEREVFVSLNQESVSEADEEESLPPMTSMDDAVVDELNIDIASEVLTEAVDQNQEQESHNDVICRSVSPELVEAPERDDNTCPSCWTPCSDLTVNQSCCRKCSRFPGRHDLRCKRLGKNNIVSKIKNGIRIRKGKIFSKRINDQDAIDMALEVETVEVRNHSTSSSSLAAVDINTAIERLQSMGFVVDEQVVSMLVKYKGDVTQTIAAILESP